MAGREEIPIDNRAVLNILKIIKTVMSSAVEAKLGALFINAKTAYAMHVGRIGTPAIADPHPNQQFNSICSTHQQDPPQGVEGHEHAIPLVALPQRTRPI